MSNQIFSGRVNIVTYDDGGGFKIIKMMLDDDKTKMLVTAKGHFPGQAVSPGTWVCFEGKWTDHPQYGRQLTVEKSPVVPLQWANDRVLSILTAQGVGPAARFKIAEKASANDLLLSVYLETTDFSGDLETASVAARWKAAKASLYAAAFLAAAGVPPTAIDRVWKKFGTEVEDVLSKDPWELVKIEGITFAQADEVARKLGAPMDSPSRMRGAILASMTTIYGDGHLHTSMGDVLSNVLATVPNATQDKIAESVKDLVRSGHLILDRETRPGVVAIYDPQVYQVEEESADILLERLAYEQKKDLRVGYSRIGDKAHQAAQAGADLKQVVRAALDDWATGSGVVLTEDQISAAESALSDNVSLITGLPGTGKTTTMRAVVSILKDASVGFLLVAPTGIAAKRLSSVVNAPAFTIHRAFGARGAMDEEKREATYEGFVVDPEKEGVDDKKKKTGMPSYEDWGHGPGNPHPAEVLIIDESSMVDMHMLHRIITGTREDCRIVLVGDPYQLPSVGAGDVLSDLVESKAFPHVHLGRIFRQEGTSGIVLAAHSVHRGESPQSDGKDFIFLQADTEQEASDTILKLTRSLYEKRANFQVLSPRHSGDAGVTSLNEKIRLQLNPPMSGMGETKVGGSAVREGDRIMIVKNDYQKGVYNGDVGVIRRIDRVAKDIEVSVFGLPGTPTSLVRFPVQEASKAIRLAYAQTVHKCVHPDTLVWYQGGLHPIKNLPDSGEVGTPDGVRPYTKKFVYDSGPLLTVETQLGYKVRVTPNHGLDVWDEHAGKYRKCEAQNIIPGDFVRLVPAPSLGDYQPELAPLVARKKFPDRLHEDLAEFLGMLSAFGHPGHRNITLDCWRGLKSRMTQDLDRGSILDRFAHLAYKVLNRKVELKSTRVTGKPVRATIRDGALCSWFWDNFPQMFRANGYSIPDNILASSASVRRAFLRGYFQSAHLKKNQAGDLEFIWVDAGNDWNYDAIRMMLLADSIITAPSRNSMLTRHRVSIRGRENLGRFLSVIKPLRPDLLEVNLHTARDYQDEFVPVEPNEVKAMNGFHPALKSVSKDLLTSRFSTPASVLGRGRFLNDRVYKIDVTEGPSMCLEVPETHQFIQAGFSGWNSQGQEYDVIVVPILGSFGRQLQRNLLYTAITRARKKVLIVGQASAIAKAVQNVSAERRKTLFAERLSRKKRGGSQGA